MYKQHLFHGAGFVFALVALGAPAVAGPVGDQFTLSGTNFPTDFGPVTLTFGGPPQVAGPLIISSKVVPFAGISGGLSAQLPTKTVNIQEYATAGQLIEFSLKTQNGHSFASDANNPDDGWGLTLSGLNFPSAVSARDLADDLYSSFYLVAYQQGVPIAPTKNFSALTASAIGPHPTDSTLPNQAIFPKNFSGGTWPNGDMTFTITPQQTGSGGTWNQINAFLGFGLPSDPAVDEIRIGFLADFTPPMGDATFDGHVDGADYTIWADNFGKATALGVARGDFTHDGTVNGADYTRWADNFGSIAAGLPAAAAVPEPSALALAFGGLLFVAFGCRRRR